MPKRHPTIEAALQSGAVVTSRDEIALLSQHAATYVLGRLNSAFWLDTASMKESAGYLDMAANEAESLAKAIRDVAQHLR